MLLATESNNVLKFEVLAVVVGRFCYSVSHFTALRPSSAKVESANFSSCVLEAISESWEVHGICGNKMPTRCNRGFYCSSYCLLNMFRAPLCPSSGAQEYYTVVAACGISCCGFQVVGLVWSWGLCVQSAGCCLKQHPANWTHNLA